MPSAIAEFISYGSNAVEAAKGVRKLMAKMKELPADIDYALTLDTPMQ